MEENISYNKNISNIACKETCNYYKQNIIDWGGDMIVAVVTALVLALYFYIKDGQSFDVFGIFISVSVGLLAMVLWRYLFNRFFLVPEKVYKEEKEKADKYTWNDIEITAVSTKDDSAKIAYLLVVNNKKFDVHGFSVALTSMRKQGEFFASINLPLHFAISVNGENQRAGIVLPKENRENPVIIPVCNRIVGSENALLLALNIDEEKKGIVKFQDIEIDKPYLINLSFSGYIEERKLDRLDVTYEIKTTKEGVFFSK